MLSKKRLENNAKNSSEERQKKGREKPKDLPLLKLLAWRKKELSVKDLQRKEPSKKKMNALRELSDNVKCRNSKNSLS